MSFFRSTSLVGEMAEEVAACLQRYHQLQTDGKVVVALSGGKDSWATLGMLSYLREQNRLPNELLAVHIDLGFPVSNERSAALAAGCERAMVPLIVEKTRIGIEAMEAKTARPCFLCARNRRKALYEIAVRENAEYIATGHHRDDVLTTFLLNLLENREISTLTPRQPAFGDLLHLIRPFYATPESRIVKLHKQQNMPVFVSGCLIDGQTRRTSMNELLEKIDDRFPGGRQAIFDALHRVKTDFLPHKTD